MLTIREALLQGARLLEEASISAPRLTAEVLLCHALRRPKVYLFAHPDEPLSELAWIHYGRYLHQRMEGVPTQYITKEQEFYGRPFAVSPAVLIPRPETEHLVEAALRYARRSRVVADIGCGSGALAVTLALELPAATVYGSDLSYEALRMARRNARTLGAKVCFVQCDLCTAFASGSLELVVCNPPYVPSTDATALQREVRDHEPPVALYGGATGNEIYARLIPDAARVLQPGGWLILELGYRSLEPVRRLFDSAWRNIRAQDDLAGIPRVLIAQRIPS